jgi:hypothetical protein
MGLARVCGWLALCSLMGAQTQTVATTTQSSAASATFSYLSDDGCIQNEVMVFATRKPAVSTNSPGPTAVATYSRYRYDYCADVDLGTDLGTSSRPDFSGDLNKSSLNAIINGHTASGAPVTVAFVLVWEGKGIVTRQAGPQRAASLTRSESMSRNAVVRGTMDERDISSATVGASLRTTLNTIPR